MTPAQQRQSLFLSWTHKTRGRCRSGSGVVFAVLLGLGAVAHAGTAPVVTQQPASIMVPIAGLLRLTCVVTGTEPMSEIWQKNGLFVGEQTTLTLVLTNTQSSEYCQYRIGPAT